MHLQLAAMAISCQMLDSLEAAPAEVMPVEADISLPTKASTPSPQGFRIPVFSEYFKVSCEVYLGYDHRFRATQSFFIGHGDSFRLVRIESSPSYINSLQSRSTIILNARDSSTQGLSQAESLQ